MNDCNSGRPLHSTKVVNIARKNHQMEVIQQMKNPHVSS